MKKILIIAGALLFFGGTWVLSDTGPATGTLKVTTPGMVVTVKIPQGADAKKTQGVPVPFGREATLPAGKYDVASVQLFKKDAKGQVWCLNGISELGTLKTLDVAQGQAASVEGGETLKIRTRIVITNDKPAAVKAAATSAGSTPAADPAPVPSAKNVTVYLDYVGKSGEHYGPKAMMGTYPIQAKPIIRILGVENKVLAEGEYKYGAKGFGGFG